MFSEYLYTLVLREAWINREHALEILTTSIGPRRVWLQLQKKKTNLSITAISWISLLN